MGNLFTKSYAQITEDICSICLEEFIDKDIIILQCSHQFHASCMFKSLSTNHDKCPMCRSKIKYTYPHKNNFRRLVKENKELKQQMDEILQSTP